MFSYACDQIARHHGDWAQLCDPQFEPSDELYAEFQSAGLERAAFDEIRITQSMPMRERLILDVAEDLVVTWMRYLCGYEPGHERVRRNVTVRHFIDLPVASFWNTHQNTLIENQIALEEIESFIQKNLDQHLQSSLSYGINRAIRIGKLARLCRSYPPPDSGFSSLDSPSPDSNGPDLDPALVPLRPYPISGGTSIALPLPKPDDDDVGRNCA
jgi:hypothetical protein